LPREAHDERAALFRRAAVAWLSERPPNIVRARAAYEQSLAEKDSDAMLPIGRRRLPERPRRWRIMGATSMPSTSTPVRLKHTRRLVSAKWPSTYAMTEPSR
jgi:hypothetical protein